MRGESQLEKQMRDRPILLGYIALMATTEVVFNVMRVFGWIH